MIFSFLIAIIPITIVGSFSYIKSSAVIKEKVSLSNFNTVKQVAENINLNIRNMENSFLYLSQNEVLVNVLMLPEDDIKTSQNYCLTAQNALNKFVIFAPDIYSIYIDGFNTLCYDTASAENNIAGKIKQRLVNNRGETILLLDSLTNYDNSVISVISFLKVLYDINNISKKLAIVKINVPEVKMSEIYRDKMIGAKEAYFIIDDQKLLVSSYDSKMLGKKLDEKFVYYKLYEYSEGFYEINVDKQNYLITYYNLDYPGWKLVNIVPLNELLKDNQIIKQVTVSTVMISLLVCIIFILLFSIKILDPLKQIRLSMKDLENENFNINLNFKGNDEIALLGRSFNRMSKRIGELINEVYAIQIKKREAEFEALQSQINPHFLYNTLDTIYWMCRLENAFESSNLVQALSRLFRLTLNGGEEITVVRKVVENLNYYILIQKKRYENRIQFNIEVEEETYECRIIKLIMQPIVENAIHHGIEKNGGIGSIDIKFRRDADDLIITVSDNGIGADELEINGLMQKAGDNNRGFGIKNVNDRIRLIFGENYGIKFKTSPGMGTTVIIKLPFVVGG